MCLVSNESLLREWNLTVLALDNGHTGEREKAADINPFKLFSVLMVSEPYNKHMAPSFFFSPTSVSSSLPSTPFARSPAPSLNTNKMSTDDFAFNNEDPTLSNAGRGCRARASTAAILQYSEWPCHGTDTADLYQRKRRRRRWRAVFVVPTVRQQLTPGLHR